VFPLEAVLRVPNVKPVAAAVEVTVSFVWVDAKVVAVVTCVRELVVAAKVVVIVPTVELIVTVVADLVVVPTVLDTVIGFEVLVAAVGSATKYRILIVIFLDDFVDKLKNIYFSSKNKKEY
jgi:hypothetical protein